MLRTRLIVSLLVDSELHLIKTKKFKERNYIGDPLNAAHVFSNFEVDELIVLDIDANKNNRSIPYEFIKALSNFTTVPLTVGGGISSIKQIKEILSYGVEKVAISQFLNKDFRFLEEATHRFGTSSISVIVNVKKDSNNNYQAFLGSTKGKPNNLFDLAHRCQASGAGELIINNVDYDGKKMGFDIELMTQLNNKVVIPIVALGGCGKVDHIKNLIQKTPVSGVACSSLFIYANEQNNVLLKYQEIYNELSSILVKNKFVL